jgi:hypothetical protein
MVTLLRLRVLHAEWKMLHWNQPRHCARALLATIYFYRSSTGAQDQWNFVLTSGETFEKPFVELPQTYKCESKNIS